MSTPARYKNFDEMCWPDPAGMSELAWRCFHFPETIAKSDIALFGSLITAYTELIRCGRSKREMVCRELRKGLSA